MVVVTAASHEFEIYIAQSASETFTVQSAKINTVTAKAAPIYTLTQTASESFNVGSATLRSVSAEVIDARVKVTASTSESFVCGSATITTLTASVEGVGVIPI